MQLKKLTIKNYPPFEDKTIIFKKGMNVIIGSNGSGKSRLFHLMKMRLKTMHPGLSNEMAKGCILHSGFSYEMPAMAKDCILETEGKMTAGDLDNYVFFNDKSPEEILDGNFMKTDVLSGGEELIRKFEKEMNSLLDEIDSISYFHQVNFYKDKKIHFADKDGREMPAAHLSMGEKKILAIVIIVALRKTKGIDDFMVIDDFFPRLDRYNSSRILKFMMDNVPQFILFSREEEASRGSMPANPDYMLYKYKCRTIIKKCEMSRLIRAHCMKCWNKELKMGEYVKAGIENRDKKKVDEWVKKHRKKCDGKIEIKKIRKYVS